MIDSPEKPCPILSIFYSYCDLKCKVVEIENEATIRYSTKRFPMPDMFGQFKEPEKTSGQRAVESYWVPK